MATTQGILTTYDSLASADFLTVLRALPGWHYLYVERENTSPGTYAVELGEVQQLTVEEIATLAGEYTYGRLFNHAYELRWSLESSGSYSVQVLSEQALSLPLSHAYTETFQADDGIEIHLWGEPVVWTQDTHNPPLSTEAPPVWVETRIPRPLIYPVANTNLRVIATAIHYYRDGLIVLTRWTGLTNTNTVTA